MSKIVFKKKVSKNGDNLLFSLTRYANLSLSISPKYLSLYLSTSEEIESKINVEMLR
jgi:hypothetical protein